MDEFFGFGPGGCVYNQGVVGWEGFGGILNGERKVKLRGLCPVDSGSVWVSVCEDHFFLRLSSCEILAQVDCCCGFTDATFKTCDRDYHGFSRK